MKIYVASSWRNDYQPGVVEFLRAHGHGVYDFRNPPGNKGFSWSEISPVWQSWSTEEYKKALRHPIAEKGFALDFTGMEWADCCIMVLPCGRSAHAEAGWMKGNGKPTFVLCPYVQEPELMYKLFDGIYTDSAELIQAIGGNMNIGFDYDFLKMEFE
jgi:hypothetical protein